MRKFLQLFSDQLLRPLFFSTTGYDGIVIGWPGGRQGGLGHGLGVRAAGVVGMRPGGCRAGTAGAPSAARRGPVAAAGLTGAVVVFAALVVLAVANAVQLRLVVLHGLALPEEDGEPC